jgi:hypothetical protein
MRILRNTLPPQIVQVANAALAAPRGLFRVAATVASVSAALNAWVGIPFSVSLALDGCIYDNSPQQSSYLGRAIRSMDPTESYLSADLTALLMSHQFRMGVMGTALNWIGIDSGNRLARACRNAADFLTLEIVDAPEIELTPRDGIDPFLLGI